MGSIRRIDFLYAGKKVIGRPISLIAGALVYSAWPGTSISGCLL